MYLWLYVSRRYAFPVGYDTPKYLWRTALVGAKGLGALHDAAPEPFRSNPDRPGFPLLVGSVRAVLGVSATSLIIVLPAAMAAIIGLGAAALARVGLRLERWTVPVFVVAVGASPNVSRMAGPGYNDNLILTVVAVTAAAVALHAASAGDPDASAPTPGGWWRAFGAALLLSAGLLIHWIFAVLLAALLALVALLSIPASLRARRAGARVIATPTGRLLVVLGAATVAGGAGLVALGSEPKPPRLPRASFIEKLRADVPRYVFWATAPLATLGAVAAGFARAVPGRGQDQDGRRGRWLVLAWACSGAAGVALLAVGASVPAHRFLAFAMGIPLLTALGLVWLSDVVMRPDARPRGRRGWARLAVAGAAVLAGLGATTIVAERAWSGTHPWISPAQAAQAGGAAGYLDRVGGDAPVVFVVDLGGASPLSSTSEAFHVIRSQLAPATIDRTLVYLGSADELLAGRPTVRPEPPTFDQASLQHWPSVRAVLDRHPIVLSMPAFDRGYAADVRSHPEWQVAPALAVVAGPRPTGPFAAPDGVPAVLSGVRLALLWAAFLIVLAVTGAGWSTATVDAGALERLAAAPAFGVASIVLFGLGADRVGIRPSGGGGVAVVAVAAAVGWGLAMLRLVRG